MATDTVIVTGGDGALGRAVCQAFLDGGAKVIPVGLSIDPKMPAAKNALSVDLSDRQATAQALGGIDRPTALVCAAGGFAMGPKVWELAPETLDGMATINTVTMLNAVAAVLPQMRAAHRGAIVTVGAAAALAGGAGMGAYAASKSAVIRLTESLAADLAGSGITANCVLPSILDTPANRAAMPDADPKEWVDPAALAEVIRFLASPGARAISGAAIPVTRPQKG